MAQYDFAVIGGDKRIACMIPILEKKGYSLIAYGIQDADKKERAVKPVKKADSLKEAVENAKAVIGGIPMIKQQQIVICERLADVSARNLMTCMKAEQKVFAGLIPESFREECREQGIICYDFMGDETLAVYNAIATGEGAIMEAMKNKDTNLHGSCSLVLGYGRCGKVLCDKLKGLSAKVTVSSGQPRELAEAEALGMKTVPLSRLKEEIGRYEYVFNTIPAPVLSKEFLKKMDEDVLIIDIASAPGGVDYEAAHRLGIRAIQCLGIPGRYAPVTSAAYLADYVDKTIHLQ